MSRVVEHCAFSFSSPVDDPIHTCVALTGYPTPVMVLFAVNGAVDAKFPSHSLDFNSIVWPHHCPDRKNGLFVDRWVGNAGVIKYIVSTSVQGNPKDLDQTLSEGHFTIYDVPSAIPGVIKYLVSYSETTLSI